MSKVVFMPVRDMQEPLAELVLYLQPQALGQRILSQDWPMQ